MKRIGLLAITAFIMSGIAFTSCDSRKSVSLKSDIDSASYLVGASYGQGLRESVKNNPEPPLSLDALISGFLNAADGDTVHLGYDMQGLQMYLQSFFQKAQIEANANVKVEGEKFLLENRGKDGVITTPSGLQYKIITEGTGIKPIIGDTVEIHYIGKLIDGKVFEDSKDRGAPTKFPLVPGFIQGWIEGLQLMGVGAKYMFWIPTEIAYGESPPPQSIIKPNSVLEFEIELFNVYHEKK